MVGNVLLPCNLQYSTNSEELFMTHWYAQREHQEKCSWKIKQNYRYYCLELFHILIKLLKLNLFKWLFRFEDPAPDVFVHLSALVSEHQKWHFRMKNAVNPIKDTA